MRPEANKKVYTAGLPASRFKYLGNLNFSENICYEKTLLIVTDTNKKGLVSVGDDLDKFHDVIIIDHHDEGEDTIKKGDRFIMTEASSASEIVSALLHSHYFKYDNILSFFCYTNKKNFVLNLILQFF